MPAGIKLVDGLEVSDANGVVQKDRAQLATEGLCIVTITISSKNYSLTSKPDLYSKGFIYIKDNQAVIDEAKDLVINTIIGTNFKNQDWSMIKNNVKKVLSNYFFKKIKRRPMIVPIIIETSEK